MLILIVSLHLLLRFVSCEINITINVNDTKYTKMEQFWKSTGFCPPDPKEDIPHYLLSDEQKINIALIGSLPNTGITHVRIHWLLNLLRTKTSENEMSYNFSYMDSFLETLNNHNLKPGFEIMGASNKYVNFEKNQNFWRTLVEQIVKRYIGKFGAREVSKWRFETWNEPDLRGYNLLNFTLTEYLRYVDGCSEGLKKAFAGTDTGWRLGGPAGLFRDKGHPLCWGLLETCNGPETPGRNQCPVQFISFHRKGDGTATGVLNGTFHLLDSIHDNLPGLRATPIANDEADVEKNWSKSLEWRGDVRYAAMIVKVIAGYYKSVRVQRKLKIEVLSNDNAFLNYHPFYFTQRTLFARFQINTTAPRHNQFIKKPAYSLMGLLSFLGSESLEEEATESDPLLTTVATRCNYRKHSFVSVMLAYGNESSTDAESCKIVHVQFNGLQECQRKFLVYRLDNVHTNPFSVWRRFNSPVFPSMHQRRKMRDVEEPERLVDPTNMYASSLNVSLKLTIPSIHLIILCCKPQKPPRIVNSVTVFNVTRNEVLVTWKYNHKFAKCLLTYEVEIQSKCSSTRDFERINPTDTVFLSFHHVGKGDREYEWTQGNYRVRAVDYWDRPGKYSEIISYP